MAKYNLMGGKSKGKTLAEIAKIHGMTEKELKPQFLKGTKHELEHTDNVIVARQIALDHLVEFPDYYDRLDKIEKMKKGAIVETPTTYNDIVLYHEKVGNWLFSKGDFYAWLYDHDGAGEKIQSEEYDLIMFPLMGKGSPFSDKYVPPLLMVWDKSYQKKFKGSEHLLGIVKGFYDEDKNQLIIEMMTTNPKFRRKGVNAHIIKRLRDEFGISQDDVIFDKPTKQGKLFESSKKYHLGGDMSKHLAPNGKPSNLTHEQWHLVRTPEFKAWFGFWDLYAYGKAKEYYEPSVRKIAKELKEEKLSAIEEVANFLSSQVTENDVLIPMPSRVGVSTDTKKLAEKISEKTGAKIFDCLIGRKRESIYELKKINEDVSHFRFEFEINCEIPKANNYFIVDNVIGTGVTMKNALKLVMDKVGDNVNPLVYAVDLKHISKVVDENAEPLVVWHGTWVETPFDVFDFDKADLGFHFGTYQQAKNRVETKMSVLHRGRKPIIKPYFLDIKTLFDASDIGEWVYPQRYIDMIVDGNIITENEAKTNGFFTAYYPNDNKTIRDFIINKHGGDVGFVYENKYEGGGQSYIALQESQIKLADGTNTKFDGKNPDIRYDNGGVMSYSEYVDTQFDEEEDRYLPSGYLGEFEIESDKKELYQILYRSKNQFEYRLKSHKNSEIGVFDGDKMIGYADNNAIRVAPLYQKKGIGLELVTILKERNPDHRFGSMTPEGWNLLGKYYDEKIAKKSNSTFEKGGLIAPNGKPSNLTHEQWHLVRTPEFKAWFGDWENDSENSSKVVDENGEPMVVYHGTKEKFNIFDLNEFGKTDKGFFGKGFYFTQHKGTAETYASISPWDDINDSYDAKGIVLSCFLNLKNPIIVQSKIDFINASGKREIREGYDGKIIIPNTLYSPNTEFIAFEPNQIKLADGTNTTFDGKSPDIRFGKGGLIAPNGKASNLTPEQYKLVRTEAFKDWFGDWENDPKNSSKVVDENGEPLVMYHGTQNTFTIFEMDYIETGIDDKELKSRFWFTKNKELAESYSRSRVGDSKVYEVFLNIRKPKNNDFNLYTEDDNDGVIEYNGRKNISVAIVTSSNQIKLADGTNTTFDGNNPDIRFAKGGLIAPNGKESNLTPEQYKLVRTKAFKDWFGDWENDTNDNMLIDENGEPMIWWHTGGDWTKLNDDGINGKGKLMFSPTKSSMAYGRDGEQTITRPFFIKSDFIYMLPYEDRDITSAYRWNKNKKNPIWFVNAYGGFVVVRQSNQIKLADGTNTTFDGKSPDIRFGKGGLIAPNGKESNLTPEQYKLVRTKAFKDWFGDWENDPKNASKVVDENGEPLVVYRGDSSESKKGFIFKKGFNRMGFINKDRLPNQYFHYFVNNYDVARGYAQDQIEDHNDKVKRTGKGKIWGKKVTPYFLNIRNPIDITPNNPSFPTFEEFENELKNQLRKEWFERERYRNAWDYGKEVSDSDLNKIFEDKLGKDYLEDNYISKWQKEGFANGKTNKDSYEFFIEFKNMNSHSDILNKVVRSMLEKNVDGLVFLELTHWDDGFWRDSKKYESGELKYDYKRWVEKPKVFATLNSEQIKLADGTNTTFDGENPDIRYKRGGRTIAQTPAPKSDRVYGSKTNPKGSASDSELAKSIKFNDNLEKAIENKVIKYNDEHPMDKVGIQTAKAVVRRGMGAYSKSHRPTISGGAPNSRQAWGLARLNKFLLKKSGVKVKSAYIQDDDLLKYAKGGQLQADIKANAYLKPSNCTDVADVEYAFDVLRELDAKYGEDNPTLLKLWAKMLERKKYLLSKSERE